ncbi:hypothetical protein [Halomonas heilongjiangensis]|uniref:Uncharacterized protein n=1 Tax=Halomonas heilongjiangensis TaxID=1387883 RepID=A0A2N7TNP4_9GAMM|nr:hypothetical protein [Halomonas heilongjiangensis]PMR69814.1 hypothetical protein C1H66_09245 [Halomonas heilongjiangensis]PXX92111.1 hypothetical protein CR158_06390 [Halomonas heilongjiangensis]
MTTPRLKERLIALIVLAALLFSPPLLLVVDRPPAAGLSWLPLYLFLAWGAVIALTAWLMERRHEE